MLIKGDIIYCIRPMGGLTLNKGYKVEMIRWDIKGKSSDICIYDDDRLAHWFGQQGEFESWTNWFINEVQYNREQKINQII